MNKFPYPVQDEEPSLWTHVEQAPSLDWISWLNWNILRANGRPHPPVYELIEATPGKVNIALNVMNTLEKNLLNYDANFEFEHQEPQMILGDRFKLSMAWVLNVSYFDRIPPTEAVRFGIALKHQQEAEDNKKGKTLWQVKQVLGGLPLNELLVIQDQLPKGNTFSYYNYTPTLVIGIEHLELVKQELRSRTV